MKSHIMWRKNFLFHDTAKDARASAVVCTLAETAKANGLNIRLYLETVMTKILDYKNEPKDSELVIDVIDEITDDPSVALKWIFDPIPSCC